MYMGKSSNSKHTFLSLTFIKVKHLKVFKILLYLIISNIINNNTIEDDHKDSVQYMMFFLFIMMTSKKLF